MVKVKVGPITAQFKGQAHFVERVPEQHRAVLKAEGRDTSGSGNASAMITAQLDELDSELTKVSVNTDLTITGRVAQFGRGALADVSDKLLKQFVNNLETTVLAGESGGADAPPAPAAGNGATDAATAAPTAATTPPPAAPSTEAAGPATAPLTEATGPATAAATEAAPQEAPSAPTVRKIEAEPVAPIDLIQTAGAPMAKRLLPLLGGIVLLFIAWRVLRRRS